MELDGPTLTFAGGLVSLASGVFLLVNWWQDRTTWATFWWGLANCGLGVGIGLLALESSMPFVLSHILAPQLLNVCSVVTWTAARLFNRVVPKPFSILTGSLAWIVIGVLLGALVSEQLAAVVGLATSGAIYGITAVGFWADRHHELRGRWSLILVLGAHTLAQWLGAAEFWMGNSSTVTPSIGWLGIIHFVGPVYALGSAMFLITMLKDRTERLHKAAASTDPLTGLANRRGLMDQAERLVRGRAHGSEPVSLLVADLDRFKLINDDFGHPVGDRVLSIFADTLMRTLRPADFAGRTGGEEFVAVLPGCSLQAAVAIAGRIRAAFQADTQFVDGQRIGATVSIGVVAATESTFDLARLIQRADVALYEAKALGRNRVSVVEDNDGAPHDANIVRIA